MAFLNFSLFTKSGHSLIFSINSSFLKCALVCRINTSPANLPVCSEFSPLSRRRASTWERSIFPTISLNFLRSHTLFWEIVWEKKKEGENYKVPNLTFSQELLSSLSMVEQTVLKSFGLIPLTSNIPSNRRRWFSCKCSECWPIMPTRQEQAINQRECRTAWFRASSALHSQFWGIRPRAASHRTDQLCRNPAKIPLPQKMNRKLTHW